ncbi:hypothetical protein Mesop_0082 [Mesorhizobium opportunistum WSM2075]|uniref:Uncharacterized protein n=1 Tax=Mesorhizobium opportunistum (strain LMG 24607 / HAMBI 3007 / WSM2075) TaxID=536019 RepID=F7YFC6_MESOW|nr:hypothetical protein Mesop_0082 [Mesorhizobium opportunistum WSM2075]
MTEKGMTEKGITKTRTTTNARLLSQLAGRAPVSIGARGTFGQGENR